MNKTPSKKLGKSIANSRPNRCIQAACLFAAWIWLVVGVPSTAHSKCLDKSPGTASVYKGTIGTTTEVMMVLYYQQPDKVKGVYFYTDRLKDIRIDGQINGGRTLALEQYDDAGQITASFEGEFPAVDPRRELHGELNCDVITGTWRAADSKRELSFYLRLSSEGYDVAPGHLYEGAGAHDDELINNAALKYRAAVIGNDRKTVADLINYPINVSVGGRVIRIRNRHELSLSYQEIFTPEYRAAIRQSVPRAMFSNYQGIMLGDGEAWFGPDGKVKAINPVLPVTSGDR